VTDFRDACFSCGGHLRENAYSGTLCPICERKHERGGITAFGKPVERADLDPKELPNGRWGVAA
jgi:hypothetical protein